MEYVEQLKYRLSKPFEIELRALKAKIPILGQHECSNPWLEMRAGSLSIREAYTWDGPSGPAIDTDDFMRASLVHDGLYQLGREGLLPTGWRRDADKIMRAIAKEDGMGWLRRQWTYLAVRTWIGNWSRFKRKPRVRERRRELSKFV